MSEKLLLKVKLNEDYSGITNKLSAINKEQLFVELSTDTAKKAFWINCYNAFYQINANGNSSKSLFKNKNITIAKTLFSLDDIEHGILRRGKFIVGFGYINNPFYSKFIKNLQPLDLDYRIHFALNCGAKSCPPIAFYSDLDTENKLEIAKVSFLEAESDLNKKLKKITTSKLLFWYSGDFMGKKGIKNIFSSLYNFDVTSYDLKFKNYDWSLHLKNFI